MNVKETVTKGLDKLEKELIKGMNKNLIAGTLRIERDAKYFCPVLSGRLRASITHEFEKTKTESKSKVGTPVDYAPHVEFPTARTPSQPFLRTALIKNKPWLKKHNIIMIQGLARKQKV